MLRLVDLPQGGLSGRKRNCCDLGAQHLQNVRGLFARAVGVTHSAASQTAAQMARAGLLTLQPGADARERIASLTARTRELLPLIEAEWAATDLATAELEAELPAALGEILLLAERAVVSRPMRTRIAAAARTLHAALPPGDAGAGPRAALLAIAGEGPEPT